MDELYEPVINMARYYTKATGAIVRIFDNQVYEIYPEKPQTIGCNNCVLHSKRVGETTEEGFIKSCVLHRAHKRELSFISSFYSCDSGFIFWIVPLMLWHRPWVSLVAGVRVCLRGDLAKNQASSCLQASFLERLDEEQRERLIALREILKLNTRALSEIYHEKFKQTNLALSSNELLLKKTDLASRKEINALMNAALVYMGENFHLPLGLKHIAKHLGLSEAYFSKLFKKQVGEGFCEYLNSLRIQKAKQLLVETYLSIDEIALRCGYTQQSYFSKIFKAHVGILPTLYRKAQHSL